MNKEKHKVCVLTPVKNEEWIIDYFLSTTSLWADHIILNDQNSTDKTKEIARKYPKVIIIENEGTEWSEIERQSQLLEAVRNISGPKILIALDADEILSSNILDLGIDKLFDDLETGNSLQFNWVNLLPSLEEGWEVQQSYPIAVIDGPSLLTDYKVIHGRKIPYGLMTKNKKINEVKVLHFQYFDWSRMKSKHRWYQTWELIRNEFKRPCFIFRQYNHMNIMSKVELIKVDKSWFDGYQRNSLLTSSVIGSGMGIYWWDFKTIEFLEIHGLKKFIFSDIWYFFCDKKIQSELDINYKDPRTYASRFILNYLKLTNEAYYNRILKYPILLLDKIFDFIIYELYYKKIL